MWEFGTVAAGDVLFSTFGGGNRIIRVKGFNPLSTSMLIVLILRFRSMTWRP